MRELLARHSGSPYRRVLWLGLGLIVTLHVAAAGIDIAQFAAGARDVTGFIQLAEVVAGFGLGLFARA